MTKAPPRTRLGGLELGICAALVQAPAELLALVGGDGFSLHVVWAVMTLVVLTAVTIGLAFEGADWLTSSERWPKSVRSLVLALPTLAVTIPVARTLFDGAFAASLPGAQWAPLALPALGLFATASLISLGGAVASKAPRPLGMVAVIAGLAMQAANRTVKVSELPDLHAGVTVTSLAFIYVGLRLWVGRAQPPNKNWPWLLRGVVLAGLIFNGGAASRHGLEARDARQVVNNRGMDARGLVRVVRAMVDIDRDGYSSAFGGADCDDFDGTRNPGVEEPPGSERDLDCDGVLTPEATSVAVTPPPEKQVDPRIADLVKRTRDRDIVLISVDALRADILTDTPEHRADFPALFALRDESVVFERAFSPAAGTDLSVSSMVTGRVDPFEGGLPTLAERLADVGRTGKAVLPSEVLRYAGTALLTRGLTDHHRLINDLEERDVGHKTSSSRISTRALKMLEETPGEEPLFFWVHYFDAHEHHELDGKRFKELVARKDRKVPLARYKGAVRLVDGGLAELREGMIERGRWEEAIVVLVSDHGESLGEHERLPENHGLVLYNALVHVPLWIRIPGIKPTQIDEPVTLVDLMPTLIELADAEPAPSEGRSLVPLLVDPETEFGPRPLPLNESEQRGVIVWPHKYLRRDEDNLMEVYDLEADFAEENDLFGQDENRDKDLARALAGMPRPNLDRTAKGRREREKTARDPNREE